MPSLHSLEIYATVNMVCSGFISVALKKSTKLTGYGTDMELKDL